MLKSSDSLEAYCPGFVWLTASLVEKYGTHRACNGWLHFIIVMLTWQPLRQTLTVTLRWWMSRFIGTTVCHRQVFRHSVGFKLIFHNLIAYNLQVKMLSQGVKVWITNMNVLVDADLTAKKHCLRVLWLIKNKQAYCKKIIIDIKHQLITMNYLIVLTWILWFKKI